MTATTYTPDLGESSYRAEALSGKNGAACYWMNRARMAESRLTVAQYAIGEMQARILAALVSVKYGDVDTAVQELEALAMDRSEP